MNKIKSFFKSRNFKYGTNSFILVAVIIAIAVLVNVLLSTFPFKLDLTANKLYSITDNTKSILKKVTKDITVYGLFDEGKIGNSPELKEVTELLNQYTKYGHIKIQYVDTDKNPGIIKEIDPDAVKGIGKDNFVFKSGNKVRRVTYQELFDVQTSQDGQSQKNASRAEQSFTGAIKYVTADKTPTVYFMTGHQESTLEKDYTQFKLLLGRNNFETKSINLLTDPKIPDDAEALIITSPKSDISVDEKDKIGEYFKKGGKAAFLFDSIESTAKFPQFDELLKKFNISLNYDRVKENDTAKHVRDQDYDILPELQQNEINAGLLAQQDFIMILPKSRSVNILKDQKDYLTITPLLRTSDSGLGEQVNQANGRDLPGPLDLAVAVEDKGGSQIVRALVFGNATFISDDQLKKYESYSSNGMIFFLNSLGWLLDKQDPDLVAPKAYQTQRMTLSDLQSNIIALAVVVVIPLLIFAFGTFVWIRRRHL